MVWKNVQFGCRLLQDAEIRYAPIEFEALGVAWAVKSADTFWLVCHIFWSCELIAR